MELLLREWKHTCGILLGAFAPCLLAGCGSDAASEGDLGRIDQALTPEQGVCVLGADELRLGSRSNVHGPAAAGLLNMEPDAIASTGSILVDGDGFAGDRATIMGDITLAGTLTQGSNVTITGTLLENTPVTVPTLPTQSIPAGTENVFVPPRTTTTLNAGGYGQVFVGSGAVVFVDGTYDVQSLTLEPDAALAEFPPGSPVQINSVGDITLGDRARFAAAHPSAGIFQVYSNGSVSLGTNALAGAVISAPNGTITVRSRARVDGCAGARVLRVEPDGIIEASNPDARLPTETE